MHRLSLKTATVVLLFVGASTLLKFDGANAQQGTPGAFVVVSTAYQDLDGDQDSFPDTGETGRVTVTLRNDGPALTGVRFMLTGPDFDVACITEDSVDLASVADGQVLTVGSLDPIEPGFTFRASDSLETLDPSNPAVIDLCVTLTANEIAEPPDPICFSLLADLDRLPGEPQSFTLGPDGLADTADDGITFESFDIDRNGDGVFTVNDTFLQGEDVDGTIIYSGTPGFYLRGSDDASVMKTVAAVACAGFDTPAQGNQACILDPDFPFDWHFHCPPGTTNCPNSEILPGDATPRTCVGGCSYDTPLDGAHALSLPNSLHMGAHFNLLQAAAGDTTHFRALQAFVSGPINLALFPRTGDLEMSFFHIIDLMDNNSVGLPDGICGDCADVQIQIDLNPDPAVDLWGFWEKLVPFQNGYEHVPDDGTFGYYYCLFTPADTGTDPPAPRGVHETICYPQGVWSNCGSDVGTLATTVGDCDGPGFVDPSGIGVWVETAFDLSPFLGRRIRIRWIGASWNFAGFASSYFEYGGGWDGVGQDDGWWLDNIRITGTIESPGPTVTPDLAPPPPTSCPDDICVDRDGDGYGFPGNPICPSGSQTDCEDLNPSVFPDNLEICDGADNNCNGVVDEGFDTDLDGFSACFGDCDDSNPLINPTAAEICNGQDDNCDGIIPSSEADSDGDGFRGCVECNDRDPDTYPGAPEINDALDNQCPGDPGHGVIDEISGDSGFHNAADNTEYSWPAQTHADLYEVHRTDSPAFPLGCRSFPSTSGTVVVDSDLPLPSQFFFYIVRPVSPFVGSWGQESSGVERIPPCLNFPDLIVQTLTHSPLNPTSGDTVTIMAAVKNVGIGPAGPSDLTLLVGGELFLTILRIPELAPGVVFSAQRQVTLSSGSFLVTATADFNDEVIESDEGNNGATDLISVGPEP